MKSIATLLLAIVLAAPALAQSTRARVEFLAGPALEGRQAGSDGERVAAEYLASELARIGARPLPGRADMFSPFEFTGGSRDGGSRLVVSHTSGSSQAFSAPAVQALSFSDDAEVRGEAVFAGYGIVVPESQGFGYDSYATIDVKDKVVVVLRYFPEDADLQTRAVLARYSDLRYKAMAARQRGARALIVITGPRSPNAGTTVPMAFDTALAGSGIPAASLEGVVGDAIFTARPLREVQQELDSGNPHVAGFPLPGLSLTLTTRVVREKQRARNVLAYLPATAPLSTDKPWVAIGAHYDHLGRGRHGNSLAAKGEAGGIHHGADDNASGSAAVLRLVELLAQQPRRRHLLVGFWSAEEIGLVGSNAFVSSPPVPLAEFAAYVNLDMVGRMQNNRLIVQAMGTSSVWARLVERANVAAGFDLTTQADPYLPTDSANFNQASVVTLNFTTGPHLDYHKPSDTAEKITYDDLERITVLAAAVVHGVIDAEPAPQFTRVEQPASRGGMAGVRVTTGTIPDYATEVKGLLLGGVVGGGPAEQAGLAKGDIIVEIAGQSIANIYDYTYALELLRVGQPVRIVFLRGGERLETSLTPAARR